MKSIRHAGIVVRDLEKSLVFYSGLLGLKVVKRMDESGGYIDTLTGMKNVRITTVKLATHDGSLVELLFFHSHHGKTSNKKNLHDAGITHLAFTVENVDVEYERLGKMGIPFISSPQISPDGYARVTFCKDPDGNFIELVEVLS